MSLAASPTDNTPGVIHGALSMPSAAASHKHNISQDMTPSRIKAPIEIIKLPDIPSPHNSDLASSFVIQVHVVDQVHPSDAYNHFTGEVDLPPDVVTLYSLVGNKEILPSVDILLILGNVIK